MDLPEMLASTLEEYITIAVRLGNDPDWRAYISDRIAIAQDRLYRDRDVIAALQDFLEQAVST